MAIPLVSFIQKKWDSWFYVFLKWFWEVLSVRIRFLGKFPIDLGGRKICLKIFLSRKILPKKSNEIVSTSASILYKGLIKYSMNRSLRIWSNPYTKSKLRSKNIRSTSLENFSDLKIFSKIFFDHLYRSEIFPGIECAHLELLKII